MRRRGGFAVRALGIAVLGTLGIAVAAPMYAAGFSIFEQGTKSMGMAGAFTAQADDPSALFYNAGGLAFAEKQEFSLGATWIHATKAEFEGADPFPGTGYRAEQKKLSEFPPHAYWWRPINDQWKVGLGLTTPFGLTTEWENPDQFAGRFLSAKAALRAFDINPTIGWQLTPTFGIGVGAIARVSDVELVRYAGANNPFTQSFVSVGKLNLKADFSEGYGFNVGLLHKFNNSFSWGLSYRSQITVDYEGDARLSQISTGNAQFDAILRTRLPFNTKLPVKTSIDFPDEASLGLAFAITPDLLVETDANWTGWSSFEQVKIDFTGGATNSLPDATIRESWEDVYNYRLGIRWTTSPTSQWRAGYVYDETPQREEGISPLLPDANRNGFSLGYGYTGGIKADFAIMYLPFDERSRSKNFPGEGPFFGTYNTTAWLLGATLTF
jgi:long-chain fatty acid transport protein